jgi:hypothetical protein
MDIQIRNTPLPSTAHNFDPLSADMFDQQSNWQHLHALCTTNPENSAVELDPVHFQDCYGHGMLLDLTCSLNLSSPLLRESSSHPGFFTPETFSATSPSPPARSRTSTIHSLPESGGVPDLPDETNAKIRKERRRAQNRIAQRGEPQVFLLEAKIS